MNGSSPAGGGVFNGGAGGDAPQSGPWTRAVAGRMCGHSEGGGLCDAVRGSVPVVRLDTHYVVKLRDAWAARV
ncbi:hypothetical protein GCM10020256_35160 [Streptomyces thermocoprophilus]